jgi:hypothetical protein
MTAFPKTQRDVITLTIDEDGDLLFLKTDSADIFLELGTTVTKRASHVEPATFWARIAFHILRTLVADDSSIAAWTRTWKCRWRVNTSPVGGPILTWADLRLLGWDPLIDLWGSVAPSTTATFADRQNAIDAEIAFLNTWFLERGIHG